MKPTFFPQPTARTIQRTNLVQTYFKLLEAIIRSGKNEMLFRAYLKEAQEKLLLPEIAKLFNDLIIAINNARKSGNEVEYAQKNLPPMGWKLVGDLYYAMNTYLYLKFAEECYRVAITFKTPCWSALTKLGIIYYKHYLDENDVSKSSTYLTHAIEFLNLASSHDVEARCYLEQANIPGFLATIAHNNTGMQLDIKSINFPNLRSAEECDEYMRNTKTYR